MKITQTADGGYLIRDDGVTKSIPPDPANRDFEAVQAMIAAGAVIEMEPPPPEPEPVLTPEQWVYFLEQTQWNTLIKQATDMMPPGPVRSAMIAAQATTTAFRLPVLLKVVGRVRAMGLGVDLPTDEEIEEAFNDASRFEGLSSLLG